MALQGKEFTLVIVPGHGRILMHNVAYERAIFGSACLVYLQSIPNTLILPYLLKVSFAAWLYKMLTQLCEDIWMDGAVCPSSPMGCKQSQQKFLCIPVAVAVAALHLLLSCKSFLQ
jgi:hypothetical protein